MLKTNYVDDVIDLSVNTSRKYQRITNADGTYSYNDVTTYERVGSDFGASDINETNAYVNRAHGNFSTFESSSTASNPYTYNDGVIVSGQLRRVKAPIAQGASITDSNSDVITESEWRQREQMQTIFKIEASGWSEEPITTTAGEKYYTYDLAVGRIFVGVIEFACCGETLDELDIPSSDERAACGEIAFGIGKDETSTIRFYAESAPTIDFHIVIAGVEVAEG